MTGGLITKAKSRPRPFSFRQSPDGEEVTIYDLTGKRVDSYFTDSFIRVVRRAVAGEMHPEYNQYELLLLRDFTDAQLKEELLKMELLQP